MQKLMKQVSFFSVCLCALSFHLWGQEEGNSDEKLSNCYAGVMGSASFLSNPKVNHAAASLDTDEQYDPGFSMGAFVGYHLDPNWRIEGELVYRKNSLDEVTDATGAKQGGDGEIESTHLLASLYYDFHMDWFVTPYVGAGLGYARLNHVNKTSLTGLTDIDSKADVFAYQVVGGASYEFNKRYTLFMDYRLVATATPKFHDKSGATVESEYHNHTLNLGLRVRF